MNVRLYSGLAFGDGDGPVPAETFAEHTDRQEVGIHIRIGWQPPVEPTASVYLDPITATQLAEQLLTAARQSLKGAPKR